MPKPTHGSEEEIDLIWEREISEEGTSVVASLAGEALELHLNPVIAAYHQHEGHRLAAAVMFEVGWRYACRVNGEFRQFANVTGCTEGGINSRLLGAWPDIMFEYANLCPGFRELFVSEGDSL